jgi:hypothetical protein
MQSLAGLTLGGDTMDSTETLYLVLILAAFTAFGVTLAWANHKVPGDHLKN